MLAVIRKVNSFHKDFSVVYIRRSHVIYKLKKCNESTKPSFIASKIFTLAYLAPISAGMQVVFQNQIKPNARASPLALFKWVVKIHFLILFCNILYAVIKIFDVLPSQLYKKAHCYSHLPKYSSCQQLFLNLATTKLI